MPDIYLSIPFTSTRIIKRSDLNMFRFLNDPVLHPGSLGLLRAGTGCLLALNALLLWPDAGVMYAHDGLVDLKLLELQQYDYGIAIENISRWMAGRLPIGGDTVVRMVLGLYLFLAVLFAYGWRARWTGLGLLVLHTSWHTAVPHWSYGVDHVAATALVYSLVAPFPQSAYARPILRLLQLHLCVVYFFGGLGKLLGSTWHNGEALLKALAQPYHFHRPVVAEYLAGHPMILTAIGWAVILLEMGYPVMVWMYRTRLYGLWAVVILHIAIALLLGLFQFAAWMILLNITAFQTSDHQPHFTPSTVR